MTESGRRSPTPTRALQVYLQLVIAAGAIALVHAAIGAVRTPQPLGWLMLAGIAIVTGFFRLTFASESANIAIDDTFFITTAILFGPGPATLAIAASGLIISYRRAKSFRQIAFNTAALALSMSAGAQAFFLIGRVEPLAIGHAPITPLVLPLLALSVVYFSLNSGLTAIVVGLDTGQPALSVWKRHFRWLAVGYVGAASVAFCLILLVQQSSIASVIMVLPLLLIFHLTLKSSFGRLDDARRHLGELDRLYLSTVETLAMAIDAKDDVTHSHVRRVQAYAVGLAQALGVEDELSIKAIKAAALLHDTGKLAVPEHILNKPGKLTESEFATMKLHVDVGADILSLVEFPYPVVPIVRCHHENWDGSGYPRGVKGEDIPIGARILSVVDCFDALTSDRPYRRRMTEEAALDILRDRRGTMYDPRVVDTFIRVYREIAVDDAEAPGHREVLRRIAESRTEAPRQELAATTSAATTGASEDVLAFVSLARLASGEGGAADVLSLSSNLIADILPAATGAWYFPDAGRLQLTASDAFGPASHILRGLGMSVGQRLSGWVAASRQPIGNSDAALDLEELAEHVSPPLRSCMSVPLMMGETFVGVLSLYSASTDAFDENRCRLIQMLAPHIASALHAASRHGLAAKDAGAHAEKPNLRLIAKR